MKNLNPLTSIIALFAFAFCGIMIYTDPAAALALIPIAALPQSVQLERARDLFNWVPRSNITQSYLQAELATSNDSNIYEFNFNRKEVTFNTENLLSDQDVFVVTKLGYFLAHEPASTSDYATRYFTYPNNQTFVTVGGATLLDLSIFWNGYYEYNSGLLKTRKYPTFAHYYTPQTEEVAATTRSGQMWGDKSGFVDIEPMWVLSGAAEETVNFRIGTGYTVDVTASSGQIRLAVKLLGFNVFNAASYDGGKARIVAAAEKYYAQTGAA